MDTIEVMEWANVSSLYTLESTIENLQRIAEKRRNEEIRQKDEYRKHVIEMYTKYDMLNPHTERGEKHIEKCVQLLLDGADNITLELQTENQSLKEIHDAVWYVRNNNGIAYFSPEDEDEEYRSVNFVLKKDNFRDALKHIQEIKKHFGIN